MQIIWCERDRGLQLVSSIVRPDLRNKEEGFTLRIVRPDLRNIEEGIKLRKWHFYSLSLLWQKKRFFLFLWVWSLLISKNLFYFILLPGLIPSFISSAQPLFLGFFKFQRINNGHSWRQINLCKKKLLASELNVVFFHFYEATALTLS